ncbi:MAG: tRNA uridine-5-carboxymethylaminomethyl(34) synthesis GTPase MnmE [Ruminococcus sp.]|nr:tRNA uridine-5-carboxymethylaminomethyl(34) synthesis GTPase MnmE [Ruminococcus sp.]
MSTISAIATPNAIGGISVIRISGESAISVANSIFKGVKKPVNMEGYTCAYGKIYDDNNQLIDDVVLSVFKSPKSYTGEDVVEISCHGGKFVTKQILRLILSKGVRLAEAGEFTKRAFLNGKMDLNQAENVINIISADGKSQLKYANSLREGANFKKVKEISKQITSILGDLSAWADYPEDDVPMVNPMEVLSQTKKILSTLENISFSYDDGRIIREGINTVIVGKPNVGKSTLMNCLSGFERSIVTDIAGTTRDVIEETVKIGDLTLRLSDTAGIRDTSDIVEKMGVDIAKKRLDEADLIIAMFDGSTPLDSNDFDLIQSVKDKNTIAVVNKTDIAIDGIFDTIQQRFKYAIEVSAKNLIGLDFLTNTLNEMFLLENIDIDSGLLANERQKNCIDNSIDALKNCIHGLEMGLNLDAITIDFDEALSYLLELTGESVSETVVNEIFSRFCVGK